jgi:hypothetical protein
MNKQKIKTRGLGAVLATAGLMLSPLTLWNDMLLNLPLAFLFAYVVGWFFSLFVSVNLAFFLTLMAIGYLLTNIAGFLLMQKGAAKFCTKKDKPKFSWKKNAVYSVLSLVLVLLSIQVGLLNLGDTEQLMASVLKVSYLQ